MARYVLSTLPRLRSFRRGRQHFSASVFSSRSSTISPLLERIMSYSISESGAPNSLDYRVYFRNPKGQAISPFHDIPLFANNEKTVFNMVVEIPRWTNAKMEICTKEALNPIKQDCKKGKLRYVHNCFPYHGYIWNYGALPQTWEDPNHTDADTGCMGDNDPIDVCEIGTLVAKQGEVKQIKVLATLALIDEGETDWKILGIDVNDPVAKDINDVEDIEKVFPGLLQATVDWFKIYKIPAGSKENKFAFDGEARNKEFALKIIDETHQSWKKLVMKEVENDKGLACKNVTVQDSPYNIAPDEAEGILKHAAEFDKALDVDAEVGRWHFVKRPKL